MLARFGFVLVFAWNFVFLPSAQADDKTWFSGTVFFIDASGGPIEYPFSIDFIRGNLEAEIYHYRSEEIREAASLKVEKDENAETERATYELNLGNNFKVPMTIHMRFNSSVYRYDERWDQPVHLGKVTRNVNIKKLYDNTGKQLEKLEAFLTSDEINQSDAQEALDLVDGLLNDSPDIEDFNRFLAVIRKILNEIGYLDRATAEATMEIPERTGFAYLAPADRFRVLSDLGKIVSSVPSAEAEVSPGLSYFGIAQTLYLRAGGIAQDPDLREGIPNAVIAAMYQSWYFIECDNGQKIDCFYTILDFAKLNLNVSARTERAFLARFATELETASELVERPASSEDGFRHRVAKDVKLVGYWRLFDEISDVNKSMNRRMRSDAYLGQTLSRAKAISLLAETEGDA